jgi:hypothetical protein
MDGVMTVCLAEQPGRGRRKHLIDKKGGHASSASRCSAARRLRSAIA